MKKATTTPQIVKLETNDENLLFIGFDGYEEFHQKKNETGGWSFMGLRPNTEAELRYQARDRDISDYCEIPSFLDKYIDHKAFADDMEEDWYESFDVQAERENEYGETLYLGFGSGTDAKHYFKNNGIKTYEDYCNHFEYVGLTKKEFTQYKKDYLK
jgi:hypothetical protein